MKTFQDYVKMSLDDLQVQKDKYKRHDYIEVSLSIPSKTQKYRILVTDLKNSLRRKIRSRKHRIQYLIDFHMGKGDSEDYKDIPPDFKKFQTKNAATEYVEMLPEIESMDDEIAEYKGYIEKLESAAKELTNLQWNIKNALTAEQLYGGDS